ncbi:MAG: YceD family protein [Bacteroidota bacterium]
MHGQFLEVNVGNLKQYTVEFRELELGEHNFEFKITNTFFEHFKKSEISKGTLIANVSLLKEKRLITLNITIEGNVSVMCDRCLEYFEYPIQYEGILYLNLDPGFEEDRTDMINIKENEGKINLAQRFYENIHLSLPLKRVHPDDKEGNPTCNKEMLDLIEKYKQNEDNDKIDPRWEKLKNIFIKRN